VAQKKPVILSWIFEVINISHPVATVSPWALLAPKCRTQAQARNALSNLAQAKQQHPTKHKRCVPQSVSEPPVTRDSQPFNTWLIFICSTAHSCYSHLNDKQWNSQPPTLQSLIVCMWCILLVSSMHKENTIVIPTSYLQHVNFFKMWIPNLTPLHHVP
jgi:hypothetical protein